MLRWADLWRRIGAGLRLFVVEMVIVVAVIAAGVAVAALLLAIV
jgi:hypothetical protein